MTLNLATLAKQAKKIVAVEGDHELTFVWSEGEGVVALSVQNYENSNRDSVIADLATIIERTQVLIYYSIFTAWIIDTESSDEIVDKELKKKIVAKELTPENAKLLAPALKHIASSFRPSKHPARKQVLMISEYNKLTGTSARAHYYVKISKAKLSTPKSKVKYKFTKSLDLTGTMYAAFNVWNPEQIVLDDSGDAL